jgi:hypothetical protein
MTWDPMAVLTIFYKTVITRTPNFGGRYEPKYGPFSLIVHGLHTSGRLSIWFRKLYN